ncbi:hypothetical protein MMC21_001894 [Puttea exsequens]|nr:hypothetical protein [Puttea exsequens]
MAPAIEAGSLASVIELANDPPEDFQAISPKDIEQPLVLYIARVPGSRDFFLTTMKPQHKVVTAQDVQSSLYYIHVDSTEDYKLLEDEVADDGYENHNHVAKHITLNNGQQVSVNSPAKTPPLPARNPPGSPSQMKVTSPALNDAQSGNPRIARKPVSHLAAAGQKSFQKAPALPDRRLLGPRPMNQCFQSLDSLAEKRNVELRRWSERPTDTPPKLPPRLNSTPIEEHDDSFQDDALKTLDGRVEAMWGTDLEHCWEWENSWSEKRRSSEEDNSRQRSTSHNFANGNEASQFSSLTLIRRYGEEQWNVGRIVDSNKRSAAKISANLANDMSIDIATPGYSKFLDSKNISAQEENQQNDGYSAIPLSVEESHTLDHGRLMFTRHLEHPGQAKTPLHDYDRQSTEAPSTSLGSERRLSLEYGRRKYQSSESVDSYAQRKATSSKAYQFSSPWNGTCEFSAGIANRSLRCKHSCSSTDSKYGPGMRSSAVSELRFNLPSSSSLGTPAPKSSIPGSPREGKCSSRFLGRYKRSASSIGISDVPTREYFGSKIELEDRLDLSLGQEHAGGGFGGKQAKLGKLIIENEGLQMLDLIVAANMALWWRVYERFT